MRKDFESVMEGGRSRREGKMGERKGGGEGRVGERKEGRGGRVR